MFEVETFKMINIESPKNLHSLCLTIFISLFFASVTHTRFPNLALHRIRSGQKKGLLITAAASSRVLNSESALAFLFVRVGKAERLVMHQPQAKALMGTEPTSTGCTGFSFLRTKSAPPVQCTKKFSPLAPSHWLPSYSFLSARASRARGVSFLSDRKKWSSEHCCFFVRIRVLYYTMEAPWDLSLWISSRFFFLYGVEVRSLGHQRQHQQESTVLLLCSLLGRK